MKPISECRYDERLKTKVEESTRLSDTGLFGELEHLKIKTRVNRREVYECDGWVSVSGHFQTQVDTTRETCCLLCINKARTQEKTYK
jgi:hypothetical protein